MLNPVIVITGATDGLGRAVSVALAHEPTLTLILHGRNAKRLIALADMLADHPAQVHTVQADFADLGRVRIMARQISDITQHISVLVNNAGIGPGEPESVDRQLTADGKELRFTVNHLAPFALTQHLLPLLDRGAPARIVNVASLAQSPIAFDDPTLEHGYTGSRAYGQSKLAMVTTGFQLAQRLDPSRVTVNSLHPATYMPTKIVPHSNRSQGDSIETGRDATLRLILDADLQDVTGQFFDGTHLARAQESAHRPSVQQKVWDLSMRLIGASAK